MAPVFMINMQLFPAFSALDVEQVLLDDITSILSAVFVTPDLFLAVNAALIIPLIL